MKRGKPYLEKVGNFSGFNVWYVNGFWIRKNLDKAFTNFADNKYFDFIPKDEFWIDYENGKKEAKYFIDSFLAIKKFVSQGKSEAYAIKQADKIEKRERSKSRFLKKLKKIKVKEKIIKKIHKKQLFKKYTKKLKIWQVRGDLVRSLFDLDFTGGGHDKIYNFIPENEVWIDDDIYRKEIAIVLIHELHERDLMNKGWPYEPVGGQKSFNRALKKGEKSAHFAAEEVEFWVRHHPKSIRRVLLREIKKNEKSI